MAADSTYTIHYLLLQEYYATVSVARQAFIGPLEKPPPPKPKPPKRPSQPTPTPQTQLCQACEPGPPDQAKTDFIAFATRKRVLDGTPPARNVQQRLSDGWLNADTEPRTPEAACTPPLSRCNTAHPEKSDTHRPPSHADQPRSDQVPTANRTRVKRSRFPAGSPEEAGSEPTPKTPRVVPHAGRVRMVWFHAMVLFDRLARPPLHPKCRCRQDGAGRGRIVGCFGVCGSGGLWRRWIGCCL